jgi:hypothetical protein
MVIYKLDAIIDHTNIVTIGIFSKRKIAKNYKDFFESFNDKDKPNHIEIDCFINKIELDKVLFDRILTPDQLNTLKPLIRDFKLKKIGIK